MKVKPSSSSDKKIALHTSKIKKAKQSVQKKFKFDKIIEVLKNKIESGTADEHLQSDTKQKKFKNKKYALSNKTTPSPSIGQYKHSKEIKQDKTTQSLLDTNNSSRFSVKNFNQVKAPKPDPMQSLTRPKQVKMTKKMPCSKKTRKNIQQPKLSKFKKQFNSNQHQVKLPSGARTKRNRKIKFPLGNLSNTKSKLDSHKVSGAVAGLLKLVSQISKEKAGLLDLEEPVFLQVECIKIPICRTKQLRFQLPHPLTNEISDILLITADKKGAKIYPEKGVEHYTELLAGHNIDFIQKVMPVRMLKQEYSQYEMRKKLVDQFDLILADANIIKLLPRLLGKNIVYKRKMPIAVHLDRKDLKQHLQIAIKKTQMTVKSNGHMSVVQVGHSKMGEGEITANIIEVTKWLAQIYPGGWQNIRSLNIKTSSSTSLPLYLSLKSPNIVKIPVEQPKKKAPVEGELSTMPGMNVVVKPDGTVILKKVAEETDEDDSHDDEILEEAKRYLQSSKTIRYGDSDDDDENDDTSDKKADAVTDAVEKAFLDNYKNTVESKTGDEDDEEEEKEDEESSDEEDKIIPTPTKKRKMETTKNKPADKSPNKIQKKVHEQEHRKDNKNVFHSGPKKNKGDIQRRGARGGKKNKLNKDQRKALIKRKKAGKK